jgi:chromosome segregation ATPase
MTAKRDFETAEAELKGDIGVLRDEIAALVEQIDRAEGDIREAQRQRQAAVSRGDEAGVAKAMKAIREARAARASACEAVAASDISQRIEALRHRLGQLRGPLTQLRNQSREAIKAAEEHAHAVNLLDNHVSAHRVGIEKIASILDAVKRRAAQDPVTS